MIYMLYWRDVKHWERHFDSDEDAEREARHYAVTNCSVTEARFAEFRLYRLVRIMLKTTIS